MAITRDYFTFQDKVTGSSNGYEWIVEQQMGDVVLLYSDTIVIDISGSTTGGTVYFEAKTTPGGEYRAFAGINARNYSIASSTDGINENWIFDVGGVYSFRCRVLNISNPITITSKISKNYL